MRTAVVGLGLMGQAMVSRLLTSGHEVVVTNRTRAKAEAVLAAGAGWASSPGEAAQQAEVVFSMVTDPDAVAQISLGPDGILASLPSASVHCDMSTVSPASAERIAATYRERDRRFVQAPVLGSKKQIEAGTLLVFGGGDEEVVQQCAQAWKAFSNQSWHLPTARQAAATKLACNMMIGHIILGLGQSLLFAAAQDVAPELVLEILGASALGSPMVASKGKSVLERNFDANFFVRHLLKDLRLASEAADQAGVPMPHNALSRELFVAAVQQGYGDEDYSAVIKVLEQLAGTRLG